MYLLIEPWLVAVMTGVVGMGAGVVVQRLLVKRRMEAVHRGAYVEQMRHAAELHRQADAHAEAIAAQAEQITSALNGAHERDLEDQLAEQARALRAVHAQAQASQKAHAEARWDELMQAHQMLRRQAQLALQNATDQMAAYLAARPAIPTLVVEALPSAERVVAAPKVQELQAELSRARAACEEAAAQRDQAMLRLVELTADLQRLRQGRAEDEQRLADAIELAREQARADVQQAHRLQEQTQLDGHRRLQEEVALLREQLDAAIVELSAVARARDAREAQRAQLALQLALTKDAREREGRIAAEQRANLQQQLMQMKDMLRTTSRPAVEREEPAERSAAGRRAGQAAAPLPA